MKAPTRCIDIFGYCNSPKTPHPRKAQNISNGIYYGALGTCINNPRTCTSYLTTTQLLAQKKARSRAHTTHNP